MPTCESGHSIIYVIMRVEERYETYTPNGKEFTKWFKQIYKFESEEQAMAHIKSQPKVINKLKHEYRIIDA